MILSQFRLLSVLLIIRAVRTLRVTRLIGFVASLQTLVASILATLQSLICAMLPLVLIVYSVALIFTEATKDDFIDQSSDPLLKEYWAQCHSQFYPVLDDLGWSWKDAVEPMFRISSSLVALFTGFVRHHSATAACSGSACVDGLKVLYHFA